MPHSSEPFHFSSQTGPDRFQRTESCRVTERKNGRILLVAGAHGLVHLLGNGVRLDYMDDGLNAPIEKQRGRLARKWVLAHLSRFSASSLKHLIGSLKPF